MPETIQETERTPRSLEELVVSVLDTSLPIRNEFEATDYFLKEIHRLRGTTIKEGYITPEESEGVRQFLQELLRVCRVRSLEATTREERQALAQKIGGLYEQAFSVSPNIFNHLNVRDMLRVAASSARIPEAGHLQSNFIGEYVYTFEFGNIDKTVLDVLAEADVPEQVDIALFLKKVAAVASGEGYADSVLQRTERLARHIAEQADIHPVVRYAAAESWESISAYRREEAEGGDAHVRSMSPAAFEAVQAEHAFVSGRLADSGVSRHESLLPIAKDAVGSMGRDGTIRSVMSIDLAKIPETPSAEAFSECTRLEEHLSPDAPALQWIAEFRTASDQALLEIGNRVGEILPSVSNERWQKTLQVIEEGVSHQARVEAEDQERFSEAEVRAHATTEEVMKKGVTLLRSVEYALDPLVGEYVERMEAEDEPIDERYRALAILVSLFSSAEVPESLQNVQTELLALSEGLHETHRVLWEEVQRKNQEAHARFQKESDEREAPLEDVFALLEEHREEVYDFLQDALQKRKDTLAPKAIFEGAPVTRVVRHVSPLRNPEESLDVSLLLQDLHHPDIRHAFEEDFGVPLVGMTLREQAWFLQALGSSRAEEMHQLREFTRTFGLEGAKTFLSAEYGDAFREVIFKIAERFPEEVARQVFARYAEFADWAQATAEEIEAEFFKKQTRSIVDVQEVSARLLDRARQILLSAGEATDADQIMAQLELAQADATLFASVFRQLFKGKETKVAFDELRGVDLQSREPKSLSHEEREAMFKMFDQNWADQDPIAAQSFRKMLETKSAPENEDSHFYVMKKDEKIVAFMRFDHRDDLAPGAYYAGSLNMRPDLRGSAIGETFMQQTVQKEAEGHVIFAHVVPDAVVGTRYVEDGFVITGVDTIEVDGKKTDELAIRYDKSRNIRFLAKQEGVSPAHLLAGIEGVDVRAFAYPEEKSSMLDRIREAKERGEVVTRYWLDAKDSGRRYLAFEKQEPAI